MTREELKALSNKSAKTKTTNPKLGLVVKTNEDGSTTITIPASVSQDLIYTSPLKPVQVNGVDVVEKDGKVKTTGGKPLMYCMPADGKGVIGKPILIPIKVTEADGSNPVTVYFRPGGFVMMMGAVGEDE